MAKQHTTVRLAVRPEQAMRHVREVVDAHPTWRVHTNRDTFMTVTAKATAFSRSPKVEISAGSDDDGHGDSGHTSIEISGTVVGFGPNKRRLDGFVESIAEGIRAMAGDGNGDG